MTPPLRIAFIGNSLPRRCGIATFTCDLQQAVAASRAGTETTIVAMNDRGQTYSYPPVVRMQIQDEKLEDYVRAADELNAGRVDVVCLQHEFGIFGGEAGVYLLTLLARLNMPIVTTLHTVLSDPAPMQRRVLTDIVAMSSKVIVMAEKGRELLRSVYAVPADKIEVIPHGIPDAPYADPDVAKARRGFAGKSTILTFGLLSKNKGIEVMIDAMPEILRRKPDATYVVLGATHPNLVRDQGEAYRESLVARVRARGVEKHVVFLDRFVDEPTLLDFISMCDVYVTPYLNESQMTSGTLAYSFGMGKAVVSTPYWHARELLADGRGVLVPFNDVAATGAEIAGLLTDDLRRERMRKLAYASSRSMTWERTASSYAAVFEIVRRDVVTPVNAARNEARPLVTNPPPRVTLDHFELMCDDTGLFQHAIHSVPDRLHGYCVDDNARALLVASALNAPGEQPMSDALSSRFAAFIQHAWNGDRKRFRNFMSFDRRWLEDIGSEDSHGRSLWALGECVRSDPNPSRRRWASALFLEALPAAEAFASPRAWSFTLLGLDAYIRAIAPSPYLSNLRHRLAERLVSSLESAETRDWVWFEKGLAYENARMSQALIVTGIATSDPACVAAGLRSLRWLMTLQTTPAGCFRPVGSQSFGEELRPPRPFDQQPLEATATISACRAAWRADSDPRWRADALRAFSWFLGRNDLSIPLVDVEAGSCSDGLHPDRANENRGGESVLSWLLALTEIRELYRIGNPAMKPKAIRESRFDAPITPTTH
ncbi:MAG TPA: glycosyltransferase family 4 protein [Steroidobacteraceae bacterium]|nr:glycosyltransferase family 4 protein [Steroidobacteraceae bacterium]